MWISMRARAKGVCFLGVCFLLPKKGGEKRERENKGCIPRYSEIHNVLQDAFDHVALRGNHESCFRSYHSHLVSVRMARGHHGRDSENSGRGDFQKGLRETTLQTAL